MIRRANLSDVPQLCEYGGYFWKQTPYFGQVMYNEEAVRTLIETLIYEHYLSVSMDEKHVMGFLGMLVTPLIFNPDYTVATELFFFVNPACRGSKMGSDLMAQAEKDLADEVDIMAFGDMTTSTDMEQMYRGRGYTLTERAYTKVL